jgi:hypothetical protein
VEANTIQLVLTTEWKGTFDLPDAHNLQPEEQKQPFPVATSADASCLSGRGERELTAILNWSHMFGASWSPFDQCCTIRFEGIVVTDIIRGLG